MDRSKDKKTHSTPAAAPGDDGKAVPVTIKIITERSLTDGAVFDVPEPPPGMCIDFDALAEDETGEAGMVLIAPGEQKQSADTEEAKPEHTELVVQGELTRGEDRVTLAWREFHGNGTSDQTVSFDPGMPEIVTFSRVTKSAMDVFFEMIGIKCGSEICLVLERGRRHISVYDSGDGINELTVRTFRVENALLRRGVMLLDFSVEIHGARAEKTQMLIRIKQ